MSHSEPEVLTVVTRMNVGGPARLITSLAAEIEELGHLVLAGQPAAREGSAEPAAVAAGVRVLRVPGLKRPVAPLDDLRAMLWLYRYMRRTRPRIVATHMAKAGMLGRLAAVAAGVPIRIHTFHGHVLEGYFGPAVSGVYRWLERILARTSTRLVAVSPEIEQELRRMGVGADRITVIRVGVDTGIGRRPAGWLRGELGLEGQALVAFVGRLAPIKGPDLFLEMAAEVHRRRPDTRFLVVGDGNLWDEMHRLSGRLGVAGAVHFVGWRDDVRELLTDVDVLVCSSRNEGTPLAVIEAAAAAVPAVATRVGGTPDIIRDGVTGILTERGDVAALADSVVALIDDPGRRLEMGLSAQSAYRERHTGARMIAETRDLYRRYLDAGR